MERYRDRERYRETQMERQRQRDRERRRDRETERETREMGREREIRRQRQGNRERKIGRERPGERPGERVCPQEPHSPSTALPWTGVQNWPESILGCVEVDTGPWGRVNSDGSGVRPRVLQGREEERHPPLDSTSV